jgi:hypothetical protein
MGGMFSGCARKAREVMRYDGTHTLRVQAYNEVCDRMDKKELEYKQATQTNCCWLTLFAMQTYFAAVELPYRIVLHFTIAKIYYILVWCFPLQKMIYYNWMRQELLLVMYTTVLLPRVCQFCSNPCLPERYPFSSKCSFRQVCVLLLTCVCTADYRFTRPPNPNFVGRSRTSAMEKEHDGLDHCICPCRGGRTFYTNAIGLPSPDSDSSFYTWTLCSYGGYHGCHPAMCCPAFDEHDLQRYCAANLQHCSLIQISACFVCKVPPHKTSKPPPNMKWV